MPDSVVKVKSENFSMAIGFEGYAQLRKDLGKDYGKDLAKLNKRLGDQIKKDVEAKAHSRFLRAVAKRSLRSSKRAKGAALTLGGRARPQIDGAAHAAEFGTKTKSYLSRFGASTERGYLVGRTLHSDGTMDKFADEYGRDLAELVFLHRRINSNG